MLITYIVIFLWIEEMDIDIYCIKNIECLFIKPSIFHRIPTANPLLTRLSGACWPYYNYFDLFTGRLLQLRIRAHYREVISWAEWLTRGQMDRTVSGSARAELEMERVPNVRDQGSDEEERGWETQWSRGTLFTVQMTPLTCMLAWQRVSPSCWL